MRLTPRERAWPRSRWTHHEDGQITLGRVLDAPVGLTFPPAPKPCSRCKEPAVTATPRGRPVHMGCDGGWFDRLTRDAELDLLYDIAAVLPLAGVFVVEG